MAHYSRIRISTKRHGDPLTRLLFVIFINDLLELLNCKVLAYADDIKLYSSINNINDVKIFQTNFDKLVNYCSNVKLVLNTEKCFYMTFTRKVNPVHSTYTINGQHLKKRQNAKDLGITFDSQLSFWQHVNNISLASFKMLGFIYRTAKDFTDPILMKILYFAFIRSKLEYGSIIWYPYYASHSLVLEKIQRRFLKYLCFKIDGNYPERGVDYNSLLSRHQILSLSNRRDIHSARFLWKLIHGKIDCLQLLSSVDFYVPRIASRHASTFLPPRPRTNLLRKAPLSHMYINAGKLYEDIFC